jgi:hypothetical protein
MKITRLEFALGIAIAILWVWAILWVYGLHRLRGPMTASENYARVEILERVPDLSDPANR